MKLFLDDVRVPRDCVSYMYQRIGNLNPIYLEKWEVVRNYDEFVNFVTKHADKITHISFDHDLADGHYSPEMYQGEEAYNKHLESITEKTGYDCAVWLKEYFISFRIKLPVMFVHSMNPVGTQKIINVFK